MFMQNSSILSENTQWLSEFGVRTHVHINDLKDSRDTHNGVLLNLKTGNYVI